MVEPDDLELLPDLVLLAVDFGLEELLAVVPDDELREELLLFTEGVEPDFLVVDTLLLLLLLELDELLAVEVLLDLCELAFLFEEEFVALLLVEVLEVLTVLLLVPCFTGVLDAFLFVEEPDLCVFPVWLTVAFLFCVVRSVFVGLALPFGVLVVLLS